MKNVGGASCSELKTEAGRFGHITINRVFEVKMRIGDGMKKNFKKIQDGGDYEVFIAFFRKSACCR